MYIYIHVSYIMEELQHSCMVKLRGHWSLYQLNVLLLGADPLFKAVTHTSKIAGAGSLVVCLRRKYSARNSLHWILEHVSPFRYALLNIESQFDQRRVQHVVTPRHWWPRDSSFASSTRHILSLGNLSFWCHVNQQPHHNNVLLQHTFAMICNACLQGTVNLSCLMSGNQTCSHVGSMNAIPNRVWSN